MKKKKEIIKESDNKEKLIDEYKNELYKLNYKHEKEKQEILEELNNKGISINKLNELNNEYEQKVKEPTKELSDKNISLNEHKKKN